MDDLIEWPVFCTAAKLRKLWPWERSALDEISQFEDGPRTLAEWNALLRDVGTAHSRRLVDEIRQCEEASRAL